jgi:ketosteroid isomerase-like protein
MAASVMPFALAACSAPTQLEFGKTDVGSITKLVQEFTTAYNAKDAAKLATLFAGGAVVMPPNAPMLRGTEFIQGYFVNRFAQGASDLLIEPKDIAGSGALAYASGDFSLRMVPSAGGHERPDRGKFLWILRNIRGKWLLEYVIFNSDFPAAPPTSAP